MLKIFLDTNIFIDLVEKRGNITEDDLDAHIVFLSPLSIHILMYVTKKKVPYEIVLETIRSFSLPSLSDDLCEKALLGPTDDFEDNVQLHSAVKADVDYFITFDKKLLDMKFFGKTQIVLPKNLP